MPTRVVQVTDFHLFADPAGRLLGVETERSFRGVLDAVATLSPEPEMILLTGDLSQDGSIEAYRRIADRVSKLGVPACWIPGNHDDPGSMAEGLVGEGIRADRSGRVGNWRTVLLDTRVPGKDGGRLSEDELSFLEERLSEADRDGAPALVALHHPPFPIGSAWIDAHSPPEGKRFREIVARHASVRVVVCAHVHQEYDWRLGRVRYITSPATCFQFEPGQDAFSLQTAPPGFRIFDLEDDGSFETAVVRVPDAYEPPRYSGSYD